MSRNLIIATVMALSFLSYVIHAPLLAQEEEIEYSWGIVSNVSSNQIVVIEHDYDSDKELEITYAIDPGVKLENVDSLTDIAIDDSVDIEYVVIGDKKVARTITVEKTSYEEEYIPQGTYEERAGYSPEEIEY